MTSTPTSFGVSWDGRGSITRKLNKLLGSPQLQVLPAQKPSESINFSSPSTSSLSPLSTPSKFALSDFNSTMPTQFVKKTSKSSLITFQSRTSTKSSDSDGTSRSKPSAGSNAFKTMSNSRTPKPAIKHKYSRSPSPPSMFSSFGFEGPVKKPPPLLLKPKKGSTNIKVQSRDADDIPLKSKDKGKGVRPESDEVNFNARSSTTSFGSTSPPSTICFAYPPRDDRELAAASNPSYDNILMDVAPNSPVDTTATHGAETQERSHPATTSEPRNVIIPECSDSTSRPQTPVTPVTRLIPTGQLRQRNLEKLTRTLGEDVPAELVKQACIREAKVVREGKEFGRHPVLTDPENVANFSPVTVQPDITIDEFGQTEAHSFTMQPRPSASLPLSTSAGCPSSEPTTEIGSSQIESYHVRGKSDQMPCVTAKPGPKSVTRSSPSRVRPKTSHGSSTSSYSSVPFTPYRQESSLFTSPMPAGSKSITTSSGVQRIEKKEGWSGEWNQGRMQDVIRKLRELR